MLKPVIPRILFLLFAISLSESGQSQSVISLLASNPGGGFYSVSYFDNGEVKFSSQSKNVNAYVIWMHIKEDTAPAFFMDTLKKLEQVVLDSCRNGDKCNPKWPKLTIRIFNVDSTSSKDNHYYSAPVCSGFAEIPLRKLASLMQSNFRSIGQKDHIWTVEYSIDSDSDKIADCEECFRRAKQTREELKQKEPADSAENSSDELELLRRELEKSGDTPEK